VTLPLTVGRGARSSRHRSGVSLTRISEDLAPYSVVEQNPLMGRQTDDHWCFRAQKEVSADLKQSLPSPPVAALEGDRRDSSSGVLVNRAKNQESNVPKMKTKEGPRRRRFPQNSEWPSSAVSSPTVVHILNEETQQA